MVQHVAATPPAVVMSPMSRPGTRCTWWVADGNPYCFHDIRIAGRGTIRVHTGTGRDTRTDVFQGKREYIGGDRADTATAGRL